MTIDEAIKIMSKVTFYWELGEQTLTQEAIKEALDMAIKALEIMNRLEKEAYKQISFETIKDIDWSKVRLGEPINPNIVIKVGKS